MWLLAKHLLHQFLDPRHARLPAHQHHFVNLVHANARVRQGLLAGLKRAVQ